MYRCHIHFYLMGDQQEIFELIRSVPPLESFTHEFSHSLRPDPALAGRAGVVFAALEGPGQDWDALLAGMPEDAELILLTGRTDWLPEEAAELWRLPLSPQEARYRFARWQRRCKERKDSWQTSQFFEAAINSTPNLIWYKTKDGIHEKVNDSFCETVNKTKEQVQGQGHAYIWDVEHDDPACIESERLVMESQETRISEETILTGEGQRLLTTYKSPLYDLDGSVMGTVGIAIDITQERLYEQELIQKSRTLETIFATIDCGIMAHSLDGTQIIRDRKSVV